MHRQHGPVVEICTRRGPLEWVPGWVSRIVPGPIENDKAFHATQTACQVRGLAEPKNPNCTSTGLSLSNLRCVPTLTKTPFTPRTAQPHT